MPMHAIRVITRLAWNARRTDRVSVLSRLRLGFVSALPQLHLDYASPTPWLRSPASIVAYRVITLIMRLGTLYTIIYICFPSIFYLFYLIKLWNWESLSVKISLFGSLFISSFGSSKVFVSGIASSFKGWNKSDPKLKTNFN